MQVGNKTILVTNGNLPSMLSLASWIKKYYTRIVAIFITTKLPSSKGNIYGSLHIIKKSGLNYFYFKLWLNKILPLRIRLLGLPSNLVQFLNYYNINIPIFYTANLNKNIELLKQLNPDIILSFSATHKFNEEVLKVPKRIAINVHYSLLPKYAGLSPYFWCLFNEEKESGCTLHVMEPTLDAGPIIDQIKISIENIKSVAQLLLKQTELVSPLLIKYYDGEITEETAYLQNFSQRTYYKHPTRKQVKDFLNKGYRFIKKEDIDEYINKIKKLIS